MTVKLFLYTCLVFPLIVSAKPQITSLIPAKSTVSENTFVWHYHHELNQAEAPAQNNRAHFPTQIIRVAGNIEQKMSCDEVNALIDQSFMNKISPDKFYYNTYIFCTYNPENYEAKHFSIQSYFDPLSNEAIDYLDQFLQEVNNKPIFSTLFKVESAKGVIAALTINAGYKKGARSPLTLYQQDHSSFYFEDNYELDKTLIIDIRNNFFANEAEKLLPFFDKWVHPGASRYYAGILRDSNYVEAQPERLFLMADKPNLFVSDLKYYFAKNCDKNPNHFCL